MAFRNVRRRVLYLLMAVLFGNSLCVGQEPRGTILGRVVDPSGALIVGAKVQATNVTTNTVASSVTNESGNYEIPYLLPGIYRVTVEMPGFKKSVWDGIELRVNDRLTLNLTLALGDVTESVVVTGETPLLESANASIGAIVDQRRATALPISGGNVFHLSRFTAGIVMKGGHDQGHPGADVGSGGLIVSGTRSSSAENTVDGVPNMYRRNSQLGAPPADLVQEFKIQTTTFDASLGHATGAVVNVSTRTGTNRLQGTASMFDSRVRAVPWFSNRWLWDPTTGPVTPEKRREADPGFLYQRWSGTLSGPVVLPKLYSGKDRTFWSLGYEWMRMQNRKTVTGTVPTEAQRGGDFSALLGIGSQYQIYDPATIAAAPGGRFSRQPLPGNIIPASRIDPIARKILGYWPGPNQAGTADGRNNLFSIHYRPWESEIVLGRLDQNFSEKHRGFIRLSRHRYDSMNQKLRTPAVGTIGDTDIYRLALDDVYVFQPSLLLNVRYGLTYRNNVSRQISQGFDLLSLGLPASLLNEIRTKNSPAGIAFPQVAVDGFETLGGDGAPRKGSYTITWAQA